MYGVEDYELIRRAILIEKKSKRSVSREYGYCHETIQKALNFVDKPEYKRSKPIVHPAIEGFKSIIDKWLEDDKSVPRKQRHTGTRVFERLRDEYGYTRSYDAVQNYIRIKKASQEEVFVPLEFDAGEEAQVDWGEISYIENGGQRKAKIFCMRLCYSRASFFYVYPSEKQECFIEGHIRAFEFFGGVPKQIAYDNLKTAVIWVGKGRERMLNKEFIRFRSHYLFETRFCNVARGNEKGQVENLVKFAQRHFFTPMPCVMNMDDLNKNIESACFKYLENKAARSNEIQKDRLEEERKLFLPLRLPRYLACVEKQSKVNKYSMIRYGNNDYSVPIKWAHQECCIRAFVNHIEILIEDQVVAKHKRSFDSNQYILDPYHYIYLLKKKPGLIKNGVPFKNYDWGSDLNKMKNQLEYRYAEDGTKRFINILLMFKKYGYIKTRKAIRICVKRSSFNDEAVKNVLEYEAPKQSKFLDLSHRPDLENVSKGVRPINIYDQLLNNERRV